jgi:hypothetical protein
MWLREYLHEYLHEYLRAHLHQKTARRLQTRSVPAISSS